METPSWRAFVRATFHLDRRLAVGQPPPRQQQQPIGEDMKGTARGRQITRAEARREFHRELRLSRSPPPPPPSHRRRNQRWWYESPPRRRQEISSDISASTVSRFPPARPLELPPAREPIAAALPVDYAFHHVVNKR